MPEWEIHNKWAEKADISKEVSDFVNFLIDFPQRCQEFLDFCDKEEDARIYKKGRTTHMTIVPFIKHDSARNKKYARKIQLKFLRQKGEDYIKAWYLHQILDYLKWWAEDSTEPTLNIEDILQPKRLDKKIGPSQDQELENIKSFVMNHSEEILQDFKY